ncbi:MAG: hypothetical protein R3E66_11105 [bacterium]
MVTIGRTLLTIAMLLVTSCNALVSQDDCAADADCEAGLICSAFQRCVAPEATATCDGALSCSAGEICQGSLCVDDHYVWLIASSQEDSAVRNQRTNLVLFMAQEVVGIVNQRGWTTKPLEVRRVTVSNDPASDDIPNLNQSNVVGALTYSPVTATSIQALTTNAKFLSIGQFTNTLEFSRNEQFWNRFAFGLVPTPRADFAMWSKFLSTWDATSDPSGLPNCRNLALLVDSGNLGLIAELANEQFVKYPGLSWGYRYDVTGAIDLARNEIYQNLESRQIDCAVMFTSSADTANLLENHRSFRESTGAKRVRWIPTFSGFATVAESLVGTGEEAELNGVLTVDYRIANPNAKQLSLDLADKYAIWASNQCDDPDVAKCDVLPATNFLSLSERVNVAADQVALGVLAIVVAERDHGPRPTRQNIRDAFVSLVSDGEGYVTCGTETDLAERLSQCMDVIATGRSVHYLGYSSELLIGDDGRSKTYDEIMDLSLIVDGTFQLMGSFTHAEMNEAYDAVN